MVEAAPRLDRRADDDELGAALGRDARDFLAEAPRPRADDLAPHRDAVRARHRGRRLQSLLQALELPVEVCIQRQLALEDGRGHEDDARAAIGRELAGEVERMLGLLAIEQRHDDGAIGDRARPACEAARAAVQEAYVRQLHRISW
jgi:hypothetical protein